MFVVSLEDLDRAFGCSLAALLENYVNSNTNGHVFNKRIRDSITELGKILVHVTVRKIFTYADRFLSRLWCWKAWSS